jgi:Mrp family chromosome partitioning ATPase
VRSHEARSSVAAGELPAIPRFGPYLRAHILLRGRYRYIVPLTCILGAAAAFYGYQRKVPLYCSEGLIRITPNLPEVMHGTDQNQPLNRYNEFRQSQALLLESPAVLQLAAADPQMKASLGGRALNFGEIAANVVITVPPDAESITVDCLAPAPAVASVMTHAVIAAYLRTSAINGQAEQLRRFQVLADRKQALTQQIARVARQMKATAVVPDPPEIALHDNLMRSYVAQRTEMQNKLDDLVHLGCGPNEPQVKDLTVRLGELDQLIESYRQDFAKLALAAAMLPREHRTTMWIFPELRGLEKSLDELTGDLNETVRRQDMLSTEAGLGLQRVTVQDWGGVPSVPVYDERRSTAILLGGVAGVVPLLAFFIFGFIEGRYRFFEQVQDEHDTMPLLGVIPEFTRRLIDEDLARTSAQCVHNIRIRLQPFTQSGPPRQFTITSASAGEGKTSLTLGLGFSFAATGARTLLIDCDMIGRGLSHRLELQDADGLADCLDDPDRANISQVDRNLWFLPAGGARGFGGTVLTPRKFRELVGVFGSTYDIVLVDTGPITSSMEAAVAAQMADRVILVIARGQRHGNGRRAMQMVRSAGAPMVGLVFNRATPDDYHRSIGGAAHAYDKPARRSSITPAVSESSPEPAPAIESPALPACVVDAPGAAAAPAQAPTAAPLWDIGAGNHVPESAFPDVAPDAFITAKHRSALANTHNSDEAGQPAAFTFFSDHPIVTESTEPPPAVMTVINAPGGRLATNDGGSEGFAAPQPDGQMDAAPQPTTEPAGKPQGPTVNA